MLGSDDYNPNKIQKKGPSVWVRKEDK